MYTLRTITNRVTEIASFEDSKEPNAVYTLTHNHTNNYVHCSCPGFRFHRNTPEEHKHVEMYRYWEKCNKPPGLFLDYIESSIVPYRWFEDEN